MQASIENNDMITSQLHFTGSLNTRRFWITDGNRKFAVFLFNLHWHHHIYIAKYLFTSPKVYFENVRETTVLTYEKLSSSFRPFLRNIINIIKPWLTVTDDCLFLHDHVTATIKPSFTLVLFFMITWQLLTTAWQIVSWYLYALRNRNLGVSPREILFLGTVQIVRQTEKDGFKIVLWISNVTRILSLFKSWRRLYAAKGIRNLKYVRIHVDNNLFCSEDLGDKFMLSSVD